MKSKSARMPKKSIAALAVAGAVLWLGTAFAVLFSGLYLYQLKTEADFFLQQEKWIETIEEYGERLENCEKAEFFAFSRDGDVNNSELRYDIYMTAGEAAEYASPNAAFNSYYYYSLLEDGEKLLYKAYEYAFDNYMSVMFADERLIDLEQTDYVRVYQFFLLDSALAVQNTPFGDYGVTVHAYTERVYEDERFSEIAVSVRGSRTDLEMFSCLSPEYREKSIKTASEIAAKAPDYMSELEKAKFLYKYFTKDLTYIDDGFSEETLYETLSDRKGQCDGFSNAMSLIYSAAGIKCAEKITDNHTWLCFRADGKWYNADLTYDCNYKDNFCSDDLLLGFGFSDAYEPTDVLYPEEAPVCNTELAYSDCIPVETVDPAQAANALVLSYTANGKYGCIRMNSTVYNALADRLLAYLRVNSVEGLPEFFYIVTYDHGDFFIIAALP